MVGSAQAKPKIQPLSSLFNCIQSKKITRGVRLGASPRSLRLSVDLTRIKNLFVSFVAFCSVLPLNRDGCYYILFMNSFSQNCSRREMLQQSTRTALTLSLMSRLAPLF